MKTTTFIIEFLIVALLLIAVITIIRKPMDIIRGFLIFMRPNLLNPITLLFLPIWLLALGLDKVFNLDLIESDEEHENLSEEPYKSTKDLEFNFATGSKYLYADIPPAKIIAIIEDFLSYTPATFGVEDFIVERTLPTMVKCPDQISFYNFNILVQHASEGLTNGYGLFKSDALSYYCYQDPRTTHNIIGKTSQGDKFSIYTLDDLETKNLLRINNRIKVDRLRPD